MREQPIEARFWAQINKNGPVPSHCPELGACWLWTGNVVRGYGQFTLPRKPDGTQSKIYAHRYAYELTYGPLGGPDVKACHKCDVALCCRSSHLFAGTQAENLADARAKGRLDETLARTHVLTPQDRLDIFNASRERGNGVLLARRYGVSKTCISVIWKGRFSRNIRPIAHPRANLNNVEPVATVQVPVRGDLVLR